MLSLCRHHKIISFSIIYLLINQNAFCTELSQSKLRLTYFETARQIGVACKKEQRTKEISNTIRRVFFNDLNDLKMNYMRSMTESEAIGAVAKFIKETELDVSYSLKNRYKSTSEMCKKADILLDGLESKIMR